MKKHLWAMGLGLAAALGGAGALATGVAELQDDTADRVVLGEEDWADRAEILHNLYRRITPPDMPLLQDAGTWSAAWEKFEDSGFSEELSRLRVYAAAVAEYWYKGADSQPYLYNAFIRSGNWTEKPGYGVAHELGHLLADCLHAQETWRIMFDGALVNGPLGTRRFSAAEEVSIKGDSLHVH